MGIGLQLIRLRLPLSAAQGGTGVVGLLTPHGVLIGEGGSPIMAVAPDASPLALISNGLLADPSYQVLTIPGGGTGQITKTTAFDALSPMSALGDLIYGDVAPAGTGTRLPGDISGVRKFLRTKAIAGIAQPPAWDVISVNDLPIRCGIPGTDGEDGEVGPPGPRGRVGAAGTQGPRGFSLLGETGEDGSDGVPGVRGRTGATGSQGPRGYIGLGFSGEDGEDGMPGRRGAVGAAGPSGATGLRGYRGMPGLDGLDGENGCVQIMSRRTISPAMVAARVSQRL